MLRQTLYAATFALTMLAAVTIQARDSADSAAQKKRFLELQNYLFHSNTEIDAAEVTRILGKPDEVRHVPEHPLLDGTRYDTETERWAYGVLGPGMFASIGFVSLDSKGKVLAVNPADEFNEEWARMTLAPANSDQAMEAPGKLTCQLGPVAYGVEYGIGGLATSVSLKNMVATSFGFATRGAIQFGYSWQSKCTTQRKAFSDASVWENTIAIFTTFPRTGASGLCYSPLRQARAHPRRSAVFKFAKGLVVCLPGRIFCASTFPF